MVKKEKELEVKFITSLVLSVNDFDGVTRHLQFTVVQEIDSKKFRCFFDVVDPSKVKLAENEM